mgnify:CR=1 FL=1
MRYRSLSAPSTFSLLACASLLAGCPTRGALEPIGDDGGPTPDDRTSPPGDTPGRDVPNPVDVPQVQPCAAPTPPTRTDPCTGNPSCGLLLRATVTVSGARSALTDFQVQVTLPATVRAAAGANCERLVFRAANNQWAPHFVTNCAMGTVWVRVPSLAANTPTTLTLHYGGATNPATATGSYDDTFDRVPTRAANLLAAYTFDEGRGTRTCPAGGTTNLPFTAFIHQTPYDDMQTDVTTRPPLWSDEGPPSVLAPTARFTRNQSSLNFPRHPVTPASGVMSPNRLVNWRSPGPAPFNTATRQLTVGVWVYAETPANAFGDNFQTVVCYGMPDQPARQAVLPDAQVVDNAIFNPWAIFFRSDDQDTTLYQGNTCVEPCTNVIQYAHITTRDPLPSTQFARRWHFMAFTVDTTTRPHTTRRSFLNERSYEFPRDLDLFPVETNCPLGSGMCAWPPEAPIMYYPAPVVIGADLNDGEAQLGLEGKVDDFFVINRAISPAEMQAYRERRQYSADPITATVTP